MNTAPKEEELEVSIIGPGYGECILLHVGHNDWVIVDSCINPKTKKPAALEYLKNIDVNPNWIKIIIASHWHDDHIRGLSEIVETCEKADFVFSEALRQEEFKRLITLFSNEPMMKSSSGLQELSNIVAQLLATKKIPKRAISDRTIWKKENKLLGFKCEITSLSPSDAAILLSNIEIGKLIPSIKSEKHRLPSLMPNHTSVVLWLEINDKKILLGADLEIGQNADVGWIAILNSKNRPLSKAEVFKIPHHGAKNADHPDVWEKMLIEEPIAILTPFHRGSINLPTGSDISRICMKTSNCFITGEIRDKRAKIEHKIDKMMAEVAMKRKLVHSSFGQVRLRYDYSKDSSDWNIELFGGAKNLNTLDPKF